LEIEQKYYHDLRWKQSTEFLLKTPNLISLSQEQNSVLQALIQHGSQEIDWSSCPHLPQENTGYRLGKEMEWHLLAHLQNNPAIEKIHHGIQRIDPQNPSRTLGEIDFLILHQEFGWVHLEFAIKFYLYCERSLQFLGPGKKDRLNNKLSKLFEKQLRLNPPEDLNISIQHRIAFVPGILFYPGNKSSLQPVLPEKLNPNHRKEKFYFLSQLDELRESSTYLILPKHYWTSSLFPRDVLQSCTIEEISQSESMSEYLPVCIAEVEEEGTYWREVNRYFVVDSNWTDL